MDILLFIADVHMVPRYFVSQNSLNFRSLGIKSPNIKNFIIIFYLFRLKYQLVAAVGERSLLSCLW